MDKPKSSPGYASLTGDAFREMVEAGTRCVERHVDAINALNVFPVPDGDTGTNMLLTMRATLAAGEEVADGRADRVWRAMARGALMGARGNSGVILSQVIRGLSDGLTGKESFNGRDLAHALEKATVVAYRAVSKPVEGTVLTVLKDAARAADAASVKSAEPVHVLEAVVEAARASVARTPELLDVLKEAGVVDAGGQGFLVVWEGALSYLKGEDVASKPPPISVFAARNLNAGGRAPLMVPIYGCCIEFFIQAEGLDPGSVRKQMLALGDSVIVVGDDKSVRVHLHAKEPEAALSYGTSVGTLSQVKIDNIDEQHKEFLAIAERASPSLPLATVAVVAGSGLVEMFQSLGATKIVSGGQSMNPSVQELLTAIEAAPSGKVIVLPNNPNVIMTAEQAKALSSKEVHVLPTQSVPQGVAALLAVNPDASLQNNLDVMSKTCSKTQSGEVTVAVRSTKMNGFRVKKGEAIGLRDGALVASGKSPEAVAREVLNKMKMREGSLITIYFGAETDARGAEAIAHWAKKQFPEGDVEVVFGGQPFYSFILSVD